MPDIHAIILTHNEEIHLARCVDSLAGQCTSITVIDSGSTDRTVETARKMGARVRESLWVNHATQVNVGIRLLSGMGGWLLRIDADEVLDTDSAMSLREAVERVPTDVDGLLVRRRIHFMGRRIRHGGIEPSWQLRLWRNGSGVCEQRWMDEHIRVAGSVAHSGIVLSDINLNPLSWWTSKHNGYAGREALDVIGRRYGILPELSSGGTAGEQARMRRFFKEEVYGRTPGGWRAVLYFLFRYVLRLGFLDGRAGWYFHALQGFWYRCLVDAKIEEMETLIARGTPVADAIVTITGIRLDSPAEIGRPGDKQALTTPVASAR